MFNEMLLLIPCHFLFVLLVTRLSHNQSWHWLTGGQSGRLWLWRMTFPNGRTCWDCLRVDVSWLLKMRGGTFLCPCHPLAGVLNVLVHLLLPSRFLSSLSMTLPFPSIYYAAGFKPGVLAVFRGQNTCFEMLTKEIVIGRGSVGGEKVNIDLMREVPNSKVSRKQVGLSHSLCVCIHVITVMRERADPPLHTRTQN